MELEYRVATQNNKASEQSGGSGATNTSVSTSSPSSVAGQAPGLNSETSRSALKAVPGEKCNVNFEETTRATKEVHHFFPEIPRFRSSRHALLKPPKTDFES